MLGNTTLKSTPQITRNSTGCCSKKLLTQLKRHGTLETSASFILEAIRGHPKPTSSLWLSSSRLKRTHGHLSTSKPPHRDQRSAQNHHRLATNRASNHHQAKTRPAPLTANQHKQQARRRHLHQPALSERPPAPYHHHKQLACNHHRPKPHHSPHNQCRRRQGTSYSSSHRHRQKTQTHTTRTAHTIWSAFTISTW